MIGRDPFREVHVADRRVDMHFQGTDGAIQFASSEMASIFAKVAHSWPCGSGQGPSGIFADVRQSGSKWSLDFPRSEPQLKVYDAVNCICDLIVELNWSRLRQNTELMCLHAAGVEMGQSLVVFPSGRRAGKSTLTTELARRGYKVFSDDILAVRLNEDGLAEGLATGVSPRLRVPLPPEASEDFCNWVSSDPGPGNRQYKFLTKAPVAPHGLSRPIGAIVTLDRVDEDIPPAFCEMDAKDVLPVLIHQNFGRFVHSGRALAAFAAIANDLPCLKLTYGNFERAADFLEAAVKDGLLETGATAEVKHGTLPDFDSPRAPFNPERAYRQRAGFQYVVTGDEAFVSDANGVGIFRMGPGMLPIWTLLEESMTLKTVVEILGEAFPDVGEETLVRDVRTGFEQLNDAGLIEGADE